MLRLLAAASLLFASIACSDAGVIGIHGIIDDAGAGSITVRALRVPESPSPVETQVQGAKLAERVDLHCMHGTFSSLNDLEVGDIDFAAGETSSGMRFIRVTFPRGDEVRWPTVLAPPRAQREQAERAFEPENESSKAARSVTVTLKLPRAPVGHGVSPRLRGASSTAEGRLVTLVLPIDAAGTEGRPIVWDVTYNSED